MIKERFQKFEAIIIPGRFLSDLVAAGSVFVQQARKKTIKFGRTGKNFEGKAKIRKKYTEISG
jgi:hypothetical protein